VVWPRILATKAVGTQVHVTTLSSRGGKSKQTGAASAVCTTIITHWCAPRCTGASSLCACPHTDGAARRDERSAEELVALLRSKMDPCMSFCLPPGHIATALTATAMCTALTSPRRLMVVVDAATAAGPTTYRASVAPVLAAVSASADHRCMACPVLSGWRGWAPPAPPSDLSHRGNAHTAVKGVRAARALIVNADLAAIDGACGTLLPVACVLTDSPPVRYTVLVAVGDDALVSALVDGLLSRYAAQRTQGGQPLTQPRMNDRTDGEGARVALAVVAAGTYPRLPAWPVSSAPLCN
jgi:hypothetical protein